MNKGEYDNNAVRYIPGTLKRMFQGVLENKTTKEQTAHLLHRDMELHKS